MPDLTPEQIAELKKKLAGQDQHDPADAPKDPADGFAPDGDED